MNHSLQVIDMMSPVGSLDAYIQQVNHIPLLTVEEEQALANRFYTNQDLTAARQLVMANLRYVVHVAKSYGGYGLAIGDLIQEGNIGLMKAVKRFDPQKGVRLISFAIHWIKAEIHEFIIRNWRIVKIATTKAQRKLFFNLRRAAEQYFGKITPAAAEAIAKDLQVGSDDVLEMHARLTAQDSAFDRNADDEEEGYAGAHAPVDYLGDAMNDPSVQLETQDALGVEQRMQMALKQLDDRSQDILQKRWLSEEKSTLQTLAGHYKISVERVRQLESAALKKLKAKMVVSSC